MERCRKDDKYRKDFMNIIFNSDYNLLNKTLMLHILTVIVTSAF